MINPSPEYKTAIQQNIRGSMEFRATVKAENLEFRKKAALSDNGHLFFSDVQKLSTSVRPSSVDSTMETGMYILDGKHTLLPSNPGYQGFVSSGLSINTRTFTTNPKITITTDNFSYDLAGIVIEFDPFNNDYATDFTINYYFNTQLIQSVPITNNTEAFFVSEQRATGVNRIELTFTKTHNPFRRLRIIDIMFGVIRVFTGEGQSGIVKMSHKTKIHPLMAENVQNELVYEIRDALKEYDPENPAGIWQYLVAGQSVEFDYFFNVSPDTRERVPGGMFYLKNPPTTKNENVEFQSTGILQTLTTLYTEGKYYAGGRTYYDLFIDILTFADIPLTTEGDVVWRIDERLKNYRCYIPLPIKSCMELIQILCQNTASIPFEDTDGYLHIKLNASIMSDELLQLTSAFEYPNYDPQLPPLKNIFLTRHETSVDSTTNELHKSSHFINGTKQITLFYDASTNQTASITSGTFVAVKFFAYGCLLTVSANNATIEVTVRGQRLIFTAAQRVYEINPTGEDAMVSMELLSSDTLCDILVPVYAKYLQEKKRYKFNYLGDPARRANDLFKINTRFVTNLPAQVISGEYSFDGGSKGTLELKNFD